MKELKDTQVYEFSFLEKFQNVQKTLKVDSALIHVEKI